MSKKVIIITGASSGIGMATATLFANKGYEVYGFSRRIVGGLTFNEIQVDVNDEESVKLGVKQVVEKHGHIDVLFNNAGFAMVGAAEESSIAQIKAMFDTNFFGAIRATNSVLPIMRKQKSGRIIHTSSIVGLIPAPFMTYYGASKSALESLSESLDHEVRSFGIRSILIEPSFMNTSINAHSVIIDNPIDDYVETRKRIEKLTTDGIEFSPSPEIVAQKVLEAVESSSPKLRYPVGKDAVRIAPLRRFAPTVIFEKIFRSNFKLDK